MDFGVVVLCTSMYIFVGVGAVAVWKLCCVKKPDDEFVDGEPIVAQLVGPLIE